MRHAGNCQRCADLEKRVAWLESELGLQRAGEIQARLVAALPTSARWGRPQVARALAALYAAKGRVVTRWQLMEAVPSERGLEDRDGKIVDLWICRARAALGRDAIDNVWGRGFRLTPKGASQVAALIGDA